MELNFILKESGLESYRAIFETEWELSENESAKIMPYCSESYIREYGNMTGLEVDSIKTLIRIGDTIEKSPVLFRLFVHFHYLLFIFYGYPKRIGADFPDMKSVLGNDGPGFLLLLAFSGIPLGYDLYKNRGLPENVARDSFRDLSVWCRYFEKNYGYTGLTPRILNWEMGFLRGDFFRLGRLQFTLKFFTGKIRVYRNNRNNELTALAAEGITFNSDGQIDGVNSFYDKEKAWESVWFSNNLMVKGNPISPHGYAINKTVELDLQYWEEVLSPGDLIVDTHIPEDGPMTMEACSESFKTASDFFSEYFPERPFKAFDCHSWFLDIQYQKILPASSNILKFQNKLYLYPVESGGDDSYWRIFGADGIKTGIDKVPRKTSMQKKVAEFIEEGGHLRSGGGFLFPEDLFKTIAGGKPPAI